MTSTPPTKLDEPFEGLINKAVGTAQTKYGLILGYLWTHGMIPLPNGSMGFGLILELRGKSPLVGQWIPHIMIMDNSVPSPMEIMAAVDKAAAEISKVYQALSKMPTQR